MRLPLLRLRVSSGRIVLALVSLPLVVLLNGCWAVAGPLIGVGVVGGGAGAVALSRRSGKAPPDPTPVQDSTSGIAESVPESDSSQLTDHEGPAIAALPAPSPDAEPSPVAAVSGTHHKARAHHRKTKAIARASKPKHHQGPSPSIASSPKPTKSQSAAVASSPLTAPPDALPYTQIVH